MNKRLALGRHFVRYSLLIALVGAAVYLPIGLQTGTIHLHRSSPARNSNQANASAAPVPTQHGATPWSIDFSKLKNGALSSAQWNFTTGTTVSNYNHEQQAYTARTSNVRIENGILVIEAKPDTVYGKAYSSARIDTKNKFDFKYGTLEVDMKLPAGNGTWPAAWLLPASNVYKPADYGIRSSNPYAWALNGEIDFAEAIGSIPGQNIPAIHTFNEVQQAPIYTPGYVADSATSFHRYGVIKKPGSITFTIDGKPFNTRYKTNSDPRDWPFDQPYYLILNLAIGGSWAGAQGVDTTTAPWQLQVRSISYTPLPN